jgi:OOP family OmpA-OmpF porin
MPDTLLFEADRGRSGKPVLKGGVPIKGAIADFSKALGGADTTGLAVVAALPDDFAASAIGGFGALSHLGEGRLGFDGTRWWLRGKADSPAAKDATTSAVAALPNGASWSVGIDVLSPLDACQAELAGLAKRNAIGFAAGKSVLVATDTPVLDELAGDLKACPDTFVHIEAHTDSDGDANTNLLLSVARAEKVVAELVKRGVDESRLYAEGYGESDPIASNATKDGKAANRRIGFTVAPR